MQRKTLASALAFLLLIAFTLPGCSALATKPPAPLPTVVLGSNNPTPEAGSTQVSSPAISPAVSPAISTVGAVGTATPSTGATSPGTSASTGSVTASGIVAPAQSVQLAFSLGGTVSQVNVALGDRVSSGQVLAQLDTTDLQLQVNQAERDFEELTSPSAVAAAELAVANAMQSVKDTQQKVVGLNYPRASDTLIQNTQGQVDLAQQTLTKATRDYHAVEGLPDGDPRKAAALVAMTNAQLNLNRLVANINWYEGKPSNIDVALANGNYDAATAALQEAQWYLDILTGKPVPANATGDKLVALETAITTLMTAEKNFKDAQLVAPIPGAVVSLNLIPGQMVTAAEVVIDITDVTHLHVETTDLSERDVPKVAVGQTVQVLIKALNQTVPGRVRDIAPLADTLGGDVVYKTTIDLDSPPPGMRAGMSVVVTF